MKKILIAVLALFAAGFAFADGYSVKAISGKVTYETAPGKWADVKEGQKLAASTVLNTAVNAKVTIVSDNGEFTVKARQNGTVADLEKTNSSVAKGIKMNPNKTAAKSSIAKGGDGSGKGVTTAASRASEAMGDVEIDE